MAYKQVDHRKAKNLIINPTFQIKFLSYFIGLFLITTLSLYSTTFLFFWKLKTKALTIGIPEEHVFFKFLGNQKMELDLIFVSLAGFNFLLLVVIGLIVSHRVAGPLFKMKRHLTNLEADSGDFKLRHNDFFQELEPVINKLRDNLKEKTE